MSIADVLTGSARFTVICGDNRDVLPTIPDKGVGHVITDPPYEAEAHTKFRTTRAVLEGRMSDASITFAQMDEVTRTASSMEMVRACGGWALVFCQAEGVSLWRSTLESAGAKWRRAQVWIKPDSSPQFTGDRPAQGFELISTAWCGSTKSSWNGGGRRGVYTHCVGAFGGSKSEHPTTKPLSLMLELVSLFTDPNDIILDPFAGSGTTGVAALRLGRRAILIEREPKWADLARERCQAEVEGSTLQARRAGQLPLLGRTV